MSNQTATAITEARPDGERTARQVIDAIDEALLKIATGKASPLDFVDAMADLVSAARREQTQVAESSADQAQTSAAPARGRRLFRRRPHVHAAYTWDCYYEHCRCGASAGDLRNPVTGLRYAFFSDWPAEALGVAR